MLKAKASISHEVEMDCSVAQLFNYITQPNLWHEWHPNSVKAEVPRNPLQVGDRYSEIYRMRFFESLPIYISRDLNYEVLKVEPNKFWKVRAKGKDNEINFEYTFAETPSGGVRFHRQLDYELQGITVLASKHIKKRNEAMSVVALKNLVSKMNKLASQPT